MYFVFIRIKCFLLLNAEVTTVEWPKIWNDLKIQYGGLAYCLENQIAVILNDKFLGGTKEFKEIIESRYYYHAILDYYKEGVNNFANFIRSSGVRLTPNNS